MNTPDGEDLRAWTPPAFAWATYGFPVPGSGDPDPLDIRGQWVAGTVYAITGRTMASITSPEEVAIAQRVLAALAMSEAVGGGAAAIKVLEAPWLKSFSAGSYSETRFSPQELAGGTGKAPPYPPSLWWLLWALMTDEKRAEWEAYLTGVTRAAAAFVVPDWDCDGGYGPLAFGPGVEHGW